MGLVVSVLYARQAPCMRAQSVLDACTTKYFSAHAWLTSGTGSVRGENGHVLSIMVMDGAHGA